MLWCNADVELPAQYQQNIKFKNNNSKMLSNPQSVQTTIPVPPVKVPTPPFSLPTPPVLVPLPPALAIPTSYTRFSQPQPFISHSKRISLPQQIAKYIRFQMGKTDTISNSIAPTIFNTGSPNLALNEDLLEKYFKVNSGPTLVQKSESPPVSSKKLLDLVLNKGKALKVASTMNRPELDIEYLRKILATGDLEYPLAKDYEALEALHGILLKDEEIELVRTNYGTHPPEIKAEHFLVLFVEVPDFRENVTGIYQMERFSKNLLYAKDIGDSIIKGCEAARVNPYLRFILQTALTVNNTINNRLTDTKHHAIDLNAFLRVRLSAATVQAFEFRSMVDKKTSLGEVVVEYVQMLNPTLYAELQQKGFKLFTEEEFDALRKISCCTLEGIRATVPLLKGCIKEVETIMGKVTKSSKWNQIYTTFIEKAKGSIEETERRVAELAKILTEFMAYFCVSGFPEAAKSLFESICNVVIKVEDRLKDLHVKTLSAKDSLSKGNSCQKAKKQSEDKPLTQTERNALREVKVGNMRKQENLRATLFGTKAEEKENEMPFMPKISEPGNLCISDSKPLRASIAGVVLSTLKGNGNSRPNSKFKGIFADKTNALVQPIINNCSLLKLMQLNCTQLLAMQRIQLYTQQICVFNIYQYKYQIRSIYSLMLSLRKTKTCGSKILVGPKEVTEILCGPLSFWWSLYRPLAFLE
eukprot:TRINITY_DN761_c0_g1_i1.p1 TRINITY_DN761_c0_g1~~TRINITY_DN761_c0_g1_i1.p1  ORF type:complete len:698 (-),score=22.51 TRINITY_DN761_c0_g1_i1:1163-3256(-)